VVARHATGDEYRAVEFKTTKPGKLYLEFTAEGDAHATRHEMASFDDNGVVLAMTNTDESICSFAHSCF